jgi:hypothetical protein
MKSWLPKMKLFGLADRRKSAGYPRFSQSAPHPKPLEHALESATPRVEIPPALHLSIMQAVRDAAVSATPEHSETLAAGERAPRLARIFLWWLGVPSTALLIVLAVWVNAYIRSQENSSEPKMNPAAIAFQAREKITDAVPALTLAPLTDELERLDQDLESAQQLLAASLP